MNQRRVYSLKFVSLGLRLAHLLLVKSESKVEKIIYGAERKNIWSMYLTTLCRVQCGVPEVCVLLSVIYLLLIFLHLASSE